MHIRKDVIGDTNRISYRLYFGTKEEFEHLIGKAERFAKDAKAAEFGVVLSKIRDRLVEKEGGGIRSYHATIFSSEMAIFADGLSEMVLKG